MRTSSFLAFVASSLLAAPAAAQGRPVVDLAPEAVARAAARVDMPRPGRAERGRETVTTYLAERLADDRAQLGQLPPGARALQDALQIEFDPDGAAAEAERLGPPSAEAVARLVADELALQAIPPTDRESRIPETPLPPPPTREEEQFQTQVQPLDPRYAPRAPLAVEVEIELDANGSVFAAGITRTSGREVLDENALEAIERLEGQSFGRELALHRIDVRMELVRRVTRTSTAGFTFELLGGEERPGSVRPYALGRGLVGAQVRVLRVRPPA